MQIASDCDASAPCLTSWPTAADHEDGVKRGPTASKSAGLRELRRRNRMWEQENEML